VTGGFPTFRAQSYRELWAEWQQATRPAWLEDHVHNLRARYGVALEDGPTLEPATAHSPI
jgi:hypothetical protein